MIGAGDELTECLFLPGLIVKISHIKQTATIITTITFVAAVTAAGTVYSILGEAEDLLSGDGE